jgi:aminoglycoside phosphotransferase (APT) family kinase protein
MFFDFSNNHPKWRNKSLNSEKIIAVHNNKTILRDGEKCIKVFGEGHQKSHVFHEALNLAHIEKTGLNVPELKEVIKVDGCWAIVTDYIEGTTLAQLLEQHPEKKEEYLELLADLQAQIHSITEPLLEEMKDQLHKKIRTCGLCATERFALHTLLRELPETKTVCHGDFNLSNIIITEDGTPYIVDWARAARGDGAADAAGTYLIFLLAGDQQSAEKYLDLYCAKSNTDQKNILRWIPIIAASWLETANHQNRELLLKKATLYN